MRISDWSSDVCSSDLAKSITLAGIACGHAHRDIIRHAASDIAGRAPCLITAIAHRCGARGCEARLLRRDLNHPSRRVAAEQSALRSLENVDLRYVRQVAKALTLIGYQHAVDIERRGIL